MPEANHHIDSELSQLIEAVANRDITPAGQERLAERLSADPEARAEFIRATALDAMLAHEFPAASSHIAPSALDVPGLPSPTPTLWSSTAGWIATTTFVVGLLLFGWSMQRGGGARNIEEPGASPPAPVARFVGLNDSRWMVATGESQVGDSITSGQRVELSSGSAEIEFNSGARLKLVGPAIVEATSINSAFLLLGEAHVVAETPQSKGFRLTTRTSTFVDISTAFSATVAPDGLSRLDVTEGEVDVVLEGADSSPRLSSGESMYVEPGERQIMTRIESGGGTDAFRFPTIPPPSDRDLADQAIGSASIRVAQGKLNFKPGGGTSGPASVLLDGAGQSHPNAPMESAFFDDNTSGSLLVDLGSVVSVSTINSYSWHQHHKEEQHRHRAQQRFTLYGFAGDQLPDLDLPAAKAGWTRIARVNSDRFFGVAEPLDRPAQQACSVTAAQGEIGRFRYLLWEVKHHTFFGELDVFGTSVNENRNEFK